jgi:hypothetical protein
MPSGEPTAQPSAGPSSVPSGEPTAQPSAGPSSVPSGEPTAQPSAGPSNMPSGEPTAQPSAGPSNMPSGKPTAATPSPSGQPTSGGSDKINVMVTYIVSSVVAVFFLGGLITCYVNRNNILTALPFLKLVSNWYKSKFNSISPESGEVIPKDERKIYPDDIESQIRKDLGNSERNSGDVNADFSAFALEQGPCINSLLPFGMKSADQELNELANVQMQEILLEGQRRQQEAQKFLLTIAQNALRDQQISQEEVIDREDNSSEEEDEQENNSDDSANHDTNLNNIDISSEGDISDVSIESDTDDNDKKPLQQEIREGELTPKNQVDEMEAYDEDDPWLQSLLNDIHLNNFMGDDSSVGEDLV